MPSHGFTIVELMLVIVVIAILAAITIVTYSNVQNRARLSAGQAELRALASRLAEEELHRGELPRWNEGGDRTFWEQTLHEIFEDRWTDHQHGADEDHRFVVCRAQDTDEVTVVLIMQDHEQSRGLSGTAYYSGTRTLSIQETEYTWLEDRTLFNSLCVAVLGLGNVAQSVWVHSLSRV